MFLGSIMGSEKTAAAAGEVGALRFDPMAMLPFCGYHMADYFSHWLEIGKREGAVLPKIFMVNWFRKDDDGKFLWPGFGENSRVLAWIFRRCDDDAEATDTPIGLIPKAESLDLEGLDISDEAMDELLRVENDDWKAQLSQVREHYAQFGDKLPQELRDQLEALEERLEARRLDDVALAPLGPSGGERGHVHERLAAQVEVARRSRRRRAPAGSRGRRSRSRRGSARARPAASPISALWSGVIS